MPSSALEPTRLLRYRFVSCAQARRHVHFLEPLLPRAAHRRAEVV